LLAALALVALGIAAKRALDDGEPASAGRERASARTDDLSSLPRDPEAAAVFPEPASSPAHPVARSLEAAAEQAEISPGAPFDEQSSASSSGWSAR